VSCSPGCTCWPCRGYGLRLGGDVVGGVEPAPHQDDVWASEQDVLDYARWITRRARALDNAIDAGLRGPEFVKLGPLMADWVPWWTEWRTYAEALEGSWWARGTWRAGAWDRCVLAHQQLRGFLDRAKAAGLKVEAVQEPPKDSAGLGQLIGDVNEAADRKMLLGIVALGIAAYIVHKL
jgi:hypothetical protein